MIVSRNLSNYELAPRCENCNSEKVTLVGKLGLLGNANDIYKCTDCSSATTGLSNGKREAIKNLATDFKVNGEISWSNLLSSSNSSTSLNIDGTTTTGVNISGNLNGGITNWNGAAGSATYQPMHTQDTQIKLAIEELGRKNDNTNVKLDSINSNLFAVVHEIQKLLKKIDDANLTNPLTNVLNRVKNFELK